MNIETQERINAVNERYGMTSYFTTNSMVITGGMLDLLSDFELDEYPTEPLVEINLEWLEQNFSGTNYSYLKELTECAGREDDALRIFIDQNFKHWTPWAPNR